MIKICLDSIKDPCFRKEGHAITKGTAFFGKPNRGPSTEERCLFICVQVPDGSVFHRLSGSGTAAPFSVTYGPVDYFTQYEEVNLKITVEKC